MKITLRSDKNIDILKNGEVRENMNLLLYEGGLFSLYGILSGGRMIRLLDFPDAFAVNSRHFYQYVDDGYVPEFRMKSDNVFICESYYEKSAFLDSMIAAFVYAGEVLGAEVFIKDAAGEEKIKTPVYLSWINRILGTDFENLAPISTGVFFRKADPFENNIKTKEEEERSSSYFRKKAKEQGLDPDVFGRVIAYDAQYEERDPDNFAPFWKEEDPETFRPETQEFFRAFNARYRGQKYHEVPKEDEYLMWISELLEFADLNYGNIFCFKSFYDESVSLKNRKASYEAAWLLLQELLLDSTFREEGSVLFKKDGSLIRPWDQLGEEKKNGARYFLRMYLGILGNAPLRKHILEF